MNLEFLDALKHDAGLVELTSRLKIECQKLSGIHPLFRLSDEAYNRQTNIAIRCRKIQWDEAKSKTGHHAGGIDLIIRRRNSQK